jgi:hypothetical protein
MLTFRRAVVIAAPLLAYAATLLHGDLEFGQDTTRFTAVHLVLAPVVCLLAWMMVLLVDGVPGAAATATRLLAVPFAVSYTAFTVFGGVAPAAYVRETNELPPGEQQAAAELIHSVSHGPFARPLYLVASVLWLAAMLAVVVTLRRRAPIPALVLVAVGAALFAKSHVPPLGAAGMTAVLAGVIWIELTRSIAPEPHPAPVRGEPHAEP